MSLTAASSQRVLFQPARSSRHRAACLALYRALVRRALLVPLDDAAAAAEEAAEADYGGDDDGGGSGGGCSGWAARRNPIHELVRRQFRRNANDVSKRLVFAALAAGYKVRARGRTRMWGRKGRLWRRWRQRRPLLTWAVSRPPRQGAGCVLPREPDRYARARGAPRRG
jgi:hypothetical protein